MTEREKISKIQHLWQKAKDLYMGMVSGELLHAYFVNHIVGILICFLMGVLYLCMCYTCGAQRNQISQLEKEVKLAYYRHMIVETELTEMTRQSIIEQMLEERGSLLEESESPAIVVK